MYILLGGTGHIGSALAKALVKKKEQVTIVSRNTNKAHWENQGIQVAIADVNDTAALKKIFQSGKRLYLLNPPASPDSDTAKEELASLQNIFKAMEGCELELVVAQSTYGAQKGDSIGDLGVLYQMEESLAAMNIPNRIVRAAYYMSNWDHSLETARKEGKVYSFYPADFKLPMVAPEDIAQTVARLITAPSDSNIIHYIEGPELYSARDVAAAFARALQREVIAAEIPAADWQQSLEANGFSTEAARSMCAMTDITLHQQYEQPDALERGNTTLEEYIEKLVKRNATDNS